MIPCNFTLQDRIIYHDFEGIMLSMKGSEKQRRSPLQLSLAFQHNVPDICGGRGREVDLTEKSARQAADQAMDEAISQYSNYGVVALQPKVDSLFSNY
jgi:uncharacterized protein YjaZ